MKIAVEARYLLTKEKTGVEQYTYHLLAAMAGLDGEHELQLYLHQEPVIMLSLQHGLVPMLLPVEYLLLLPG